MCYYLIFCSLLGLLSSRVAKKVRVKSYYKYANILALLIIVLAGFSSISTQQKVSFSIPAATDQPILSPVATNGSTISKLQPVNATPLTSIATTAKIPQAKKAPVQAAVSTGTTCANYYGYISIGGRNICLASTSSTSGSLSYSHAYIFNSPNQNSFNQYIFGHSSASIFGSLANLPVGTSFGLTIGGDTTQYRISLKEVSCDYSNPSYPCTNYPEPVLNMSDAVYPFRKGADLAIMTCAGTAIGNGDATHRLTVYATKQ